MNCNMNVSSWSLQGLQQPKTQKNQAKNCRPLNLWPVRVQKGSANGEEAQKPQSILLSLLAFIDGGLQGNHALY